jgi:hypothetical protein
MIKSDIIQGNTPKYLDWGTPVYKKPSIGGSNDSRGETMYRLSSGGYLKREQNSRFIL